MRGPCIVVMNSYVVYVCMYALLMFITNSRLLTHFSFAWHTCFIDAYFVFTCCILYYGIVFQNPVTQKLFMFIEMYGANLCEIHHFEK